MVTSDDIDGGPFAFRHTFAKGKRAITTSGFYSHLNRVSSAGRSKGHPTLKVLSFSLQDSRKAVCRAFWYPLWARERDVGEWPFSGLQGRSPIGKYTTGQ